MKRLAILGAFVLAGCPSLTTMGTARTIERDTTQTWVAAEAVGVSFEADGDTVSGTFPQFEFGFRRGITDGFELGGRLFLLGAELDGKVQLVRSESQDSGIDIAIAPGVGWFGVNVADTRFNVVSGYLTIPVGINLPGGSQLVLGPKGIYQRWMLNAGSSDILFVGGSVGFAWKLGTMYILPEIAVVQPIIKPASNESLKLNATFFQGGIGLLFGG